MACVPAAESKTSFDIEERPTWRKSGVATSTMLKDITNWRKKYTNFSKDDERFLKIFVKSMAVDYLLNLNQDELVGTQTKEDTEEVIQKILDKIKPHDPPQAEKETVNTYKAMEKMFEFKNEMDGTGILTVDQINAVHKVLLEDLHRCCGTIRKTETYTSWDDGPHVYPDPERVEGLLYALIDHHNISMESLPKDINSLEYATKVFKCAARLLFDFVDTHPYGDGNGRMCRLLANHITGLITPFPVSLYHKRGDRSDRKDYINAIVRCRNNPSEGPRELAAMLVEGAWHGWKKLLQNVESQPKTSVVVRKSLIEGENYVLYKIQHIKNDIEYRSPGISIEKLVSKTIEAVKKADISCLEQSHYLTIPIIIDTHSLFYVHIYN